MVNFIEQEQVEKGDKMMMHPNMIILAKEGEEEEHAEEGVPCLEMIKMKYIPPGCTNGFHSGVIYHFM